MIRQRQKQSCDSAGSSSGGGGSRDEVEEVRDGRAGVPGTIRYDTVQYNTGNLLVTFVPTRQTKQEIARASGGLERPACKC